MTTRISILCVLILAACTARVEAQLTIPGATGFDGPFIAIATQDPEVVIDLSQAVPGTWDVTNGAGDGVYDNDKWAVVFQYSSVFIDAGVTVRFINHPSGAPVVWIVQGDVTIDGSIVLNGETASTSSATFAEPGPGGFRGGRPTADIVNDFVSAGLGPGGGNYSLKGAISSAASHATLGEGLLPGPVYSNSRIIPLVGGSGASAWRAGIHLGGGAGGGAILIIARDALLVNGTVQANGGFGQGSSGSGGAIRLVADRIDGSGLLSAVGGPAGNLGGGLGRISVEANTVALMDPGSPNFVVSVPDNPPMIWPPIDAPRITPTVIGGQPIDNTDLSASMDFDLADVTITGTGGVTLVIEAENLPLDSAMTVRIVPLSGPPATFPATPVSGDGLASTWNAIVDLPADLTSAIQVFAELP